MIPDNKELIILFTWCQGLSKAIEALVAVV